MVEDKVSYFTPRWFMRLFAARFSFGDTFYAGMFGSGLLFVPAGFVIGGFVQVVAPDSMPVAILWMTVFYAVYVSVLTPAILKTGLASKGVGAWRWFGMLLTLAAAVSLWWTVYKFAIAL